MIVGSNRDIVNRMARASGIIPRARQFAGINGNMAIRTSTSSHRASAWQR
jgi:hypothetical protein